MMPNRDRTATLLAPLAAMENAMNEDLAGGYRIRVAQYVRCPAKRHDQFAYMMTERTATFRKLIERFHCFDKSCCNAPGSFRILA